MYHLEVRQFPHEFKHFNVAEQELRAITVPWVREEQFELGERKWSPHEAKLTILEGPHLRLDQLSMGRGWPTALREGRDVTDRVLAETRQALASAPPPSAVPSGPPQPSAASPASPSGSQATAPTDTSPPDPIALGVELASLLGDDPGGLLAAWRRVAARSTGLSPSEALSLAEREIAGPGEA